MEKTVKRKIRLSASIVCAAAVIFAAGYWLLTRTKIVEDVKRQAAAVFVYEYIPDQSISPETTEAFSQKDSIYTDFRTKFRFHYQTIGVADFADSSKMILISEPPPHFETDSIRSIFSKFSHSSEIKHHKIGYDGRISDIIIILSNATEENVNNLVKRLSKKLYYSDYKPVITELPSSEKKVYFSKSSLDYQISLYEFYDWFIENEEEFVILPDTNTSYTINSIFQKKKAGVYFSKLPGFVAWALPKNSDLKDNIQTIRPFTLDADLILGGLADSNMLVIIGREREAPLNELPPLNVESVLLLASVTDKELSQSLDVNDLMAGKMKDGKDWCPTYLSRELENTEFGHLMTITDILLKDWSESGTIKEAHYHYPEPGYYPFDKPLFKKLGLNELVYNWNTTDAMYAIDLEEATIYTLNRTGSLPVSYFNSPERSVSIGAKYENRAYGYFATLNNPDLVRVVQYTALYQLFMDNNITYSGETYSAFPKNKPYLLLQPTKRLLSIFKQLSDKEITYFTDSLSSKIFEEYHKSKVNAQMAENENTYHFSYSDEDRKQIYKDIKQDNSQHIKADMYNVKNMLNSLNEEQFNKLARYLSYPRGTRINNREDYNIAMKGHSVNRLMREIGKNNLSIIGLDLAEVKNFFVGNLSKSTARYLKTPSVIITFNDFYTTGGHNLSSRISRVKSMTNYKHAKNVGREEFAAAPEQPKEPATTPAATTPTQKTTAPQQRQGNGKPATQPQGSGKPTATKPATKPAAKPAPSGKTLVQQHSTRPRSSVIPTQSRPQRGL
ncbi:MAG: hypothetical protein J6W84_08800 [Bacteroidales bacterium]|nr:hypothetical protein [Bacteroidales bacterium]